MHGPPPPLKKRLSLAFRMVFPGLGGGTKAWGGYAGMMGRLIGTLPGSQRDLAKDVGDPAQNGAVSICLNYIARQFTEPKLEVRREKADGTEERIPGHPLPKLIARPNGYYDGKSLWGSTTVSYGTDGNGYWLKARGMSGFGSPVELWYVPHWQIAPRWSADGSNFISHYEYYVDGRAYPLPREQVVHFYDKVDPVRRRGVSAIYPQLRSIGADNEADTFCYAILKNMGIPGVLLNPKNPEDIITPETRNDLTEWWAENFTGDNRGKPLIPSVMMEPSKLGLSPEELALDRIRTFPEDRICAALGLNPMVVGLTSGAQHKTYANYQEARRAAYDDCIIPLQKRMAECLTEQIGPDFGLLPNEYLAWNYEGVKALQEDEDLRANRARSDYAGGVCTRAEARKARGYEVDEQRDHVFVASVTTLPADEAGATDEPTPREKHEGQQEDRQADAAERRDVARAEKRKGRVRT